MSLAEQKQIVSIENICRNKQKKKRKERKKTIGEKDVRTFCLSSFYIQGSRTA
jgi:hypothetical protein